MALFCNLPKNSLNSHGFSISWKSMKKHPRSVLAWRVACLLAIVVFFAISALHPTSINAVAGHDDAWFVVRAESIVNGDWLGPYNEMTLIKGPTYPVFLAINHFLGTPLWLLQATLYLAACVAFTASLQSVTSSHSLRSALFVILLLQPALLPTRLIRDNIYPALLLFSLSGFLLTADNSKKGLVYIKIIISGLALSLFWHTREENIWIVPCVTLILFWSFAQARTSEISIKPWLTRIILLLGVSLIPTIVFTTLNYSYYKTTDIVDFKGKAFQGALNSLSSVTENSEQPYLPVSSAKRQLIYRYSPSFNELSQTLEDPDNGWKRAGCPIYPHTCGDFAGGWFAWALRAAAQSHGKYSSPEVAEGFYQKITHDISSACEAGELVCKKPLIPFIPRITATDIRRMPSSIMEGILLTLNQWKNLPSVSYSSGSSVRISETQSFIHEASTPSILGQSIQFIANQDTAKLVKIACTEKVFRSQLAPKINKFDSKIEFLSEDNPNRIVFSSFIPENTSCRLIVDEKEISIDKNTMRPGNIVNTGLHRIYIKRASIQPNQTSLDDLRTRARQTLFLAYKYMTPAIVFIGILGLLTSTLILLGRPAKAWIIVIPACAFWVLYSTRIIILALIDITSFPGMNHLYLIPAFPVLLIAATLSLQTTVELLRTRHINQYQHRTQTWI